MPVVPITQRTQQAQGYQPATIKAAAVDLSPLAEGAQQAAQVWQKTIDDADNAAAYQSATRAQSTLNTMLWDKDTGLLNTRRGENAIGVADDGLKQFDAWVQSERAKLKNPRQVELFDKLTAAPRDGFQRQLLQHQSREFEAWQGETYKNAIQTANESAATNYRDDASLDSGLVGLRGAIATRLQSQGAANLIGDEIKRAEGGYFASAIASALSANDFMRASALFQLHGEKIDPAIKARFSAAIDGAKSHMAVMGAVDELTAGGEWDVAAVDAELRKRFSGDESSLKAARSEITYRRNVRDAAQEEALAAITAPMERLLGDADRSGAMISPSAPELLAMRSRNPEAYRQFADRVADHNEQVKSRNEAATRRAEVMSSGERGANAINLKFDMLSNPDKYRNANMGQVIAPLVRDGKITAEAGNGLLGIWDKLRTGEGAQEMASFGTAESLMSDMLAGSYISKGPGDTPKKFSALPKDEQAALKARMRASIDGALQAMQRMEGRKYGKDDIKQVVMDAFRSTTQKGWGASEPITVADPEGAAGRAINRRVSEEYAAIPAGTLDAITASLKKNGQPVTKSNIIRYYKALGN